MSLNDVIYYIEYELVVSSAGVRDITYGAP